MNGKLERSRTVVHGLRTVRVRDRIVLGRVVGVSEEDHRSMNRLSENIKCLVRAMGWYTENQKAIADGEEPPYGVNAFEELAQYM